MFGRNAQGFDENMKILRSLMKFCKKKKLALKIAEIVQKFWKSQNLNSYKETWKIEGKKNTAREKSIHIWTPVSIPPRADPPKFDLPRCHPPGSTRPVTLGEEVVFRRGVRRKPPGKVGEGRGREHHGGAAASPDLTRQRVQYVRSVNHKITFLLQFSIAEIIFVSLFSEEKHCLKHVVLTSVEIFVLKYH